MKKLTPERWIYYAKEQLEYSRDYRMVGGTNAALSSMHLTYASSNAIRAVLTHYNIEFGRKFFLHKLMPEFEKNKINIPDKVKDMVKIDKYEKMSTRYSTPSATNKEVINSYNKVNDLIKWAEKIIHDKNVLFK